MQSKAGMWHMRKAPRKWTIILVFCWRSGEPTNEARAKTKFIWALPCKEEETNSKKEDYRQFYWSQRSDLTRWLKASRHHAKFASEK